MKYSTIFAFLSTALTTGAAPTSAPETSALQVRGGDWITIAHTTRTSPPTKIVWHGGDEPCQGKYLVLGKDGLDPNPCEYPFSFNGQTYTAKGCGSETPWLQDQNGNKVSTCVWSGKDHGCGAYDYALAMEWNCGI